MLFKRYMNSYNYFDSFLHLIIAPGINCYSKRHHFDRFTFRKQIFLINNFFLISQSITYVICSGFLYHLPDSIMFLVASGTCV